MSLDLFIAPLSHPQPTLSNWAKSSIASNHQDCNTVTIGSYQKMSDSFWSQLSICKYIIYMCIYILYMYIYIYMVIIYRYISEFLAIQRLRGYIQSLSWPTYWIILIYVWGTGFVQFRPPVVWVAHSCGCKHEFNMLRLMYSSSIDGSHINKRPHATKQEKPAED